jgi:hypothetical protein
MSVERQALLGPVDGGALMTDWSAEETDDPAYADRRNFYKVEKWSRDGLRVELMLFAGNNLEKARRIFERTVKHRPRVRLTIHQRLRVLDEWPRHETMLLMHRTAKYCPNSEPFVLV